MGLGASLEKTNENSKVSIRNALFSVLGRDVRTPWHVDCFVAQVKCLVHRLHHKMKIQFFVNNILDIKYEPNGYTYSYIYSGATTTSNNYFPMAGRNYWLSLLIDIK